MRRGGKVAAARRLVAQPGRSEHAAINTDAPATARQRMKSPRSWGTGGLRRKARLWPFGTALLSAQPAGSLEAKAGPRVERCKEETHLPLCQDCLQLLQEDAERFWEPLRARR